MSVHLLAVLVKLGLLFYIPRLRDVNHVQKFLKIYRKYDRFSDYILWGTGALLLLITSPKYLLKPWLLISMLLYLVMFLVIKKVLVGGMLKIAASQKKFAREEIKKLRVENFCVILIIVLILSGIGYLMMTKPT